MNRRPCKLVILNTGLIYESITIADLGNRLLKLAPEVRPSVLEILKIYDEGGLLVPTITIDRKTPDLTMVYNGWIKGRDNITVTIFFSSTGSVEYRFGNTMWIPSSLESLKKALPRFMEYFKGAKSSSDATS